MFDIQRFSLQDGPGIRTLVFLKGCPVSCLWCANPESQNPFAELGFLSDRCNRCGKCLPVCPEQAISLVDDTLPNIDRKKCTNCGKCIEVCSPGAFVLYGKEMTAREVIDEVRLDDMFYKGSGGGMTLSGGEPLRQPSFTKALLNLSRQEGIHSAIETCGFTKGELFEEILAAVDYVLFDLKHMHPEQHRKLTGQSNALILGNAGTLVKSGVPHLFRMPLIPGYNDSEENIKATANFIRELEGEKATIEIMPYHTLGLVKYRALGMTYPLGGLKAIELSQVKPVQQLFEEAGVKCLISR